MVPLLRRWALAFVFTAIALYGLYRLNELGALSDLEGSFDPIELPEKVALKNLPLFKWKDVPQHNPVSSMMALPSAKPLAIPRIQYEFEAGDYRHTKERVSRQQEVKKSFIHAWNGYKQHAWLQDEVSPLTGSYSNDFGGWGATLVDTLDTLWIMGLEKDFAIAVAALNKIDFTSTSLKELNIFETTIRYLGGFLSAYDLSEGKYPLLLEKATELGEMLYSAFDTPNRMPITRWEWENGAQGLPQYALAQTLIAEIGSLSLEFTRLSQLTGDPKYYDAVQRVTDSLETQQNRTKIPGLWPVYVNAKHEEWNVDRTFTFGGMSDSLYEYFPKQYMILGGHLDQYRTMYETALAAAKEYLFFRPLNPDNQNILISGTVRKNAANHIKIEPVGQHLSCFAGGMVGIGAKIFNRPEDLDVARKLVDGCIWAYESMPTGIAPESFTVARCNDSDDCDWTEMKWLQAIVDKKRFGAMETDRAKAYAERYRYPPGFTDIAERMYILRPEAIESIFILYRITGDLRLQEKAWQMFQNVQKYTKTGIGNAAINDVTAEEPEQLDKCESFWMAETLKYFYLIFSEPDFISLDEYVFNTEAHPFKRPT